MRKLYVIYNLKRNRYFWYTKLNHGWERNINYATVFNTKKQALEFLTSDHGYNDFRSTLVEIKEIITVFKTS